MIKQAESDSLTTHENQVVNVASSRNSTKRKNSEQVTLTHITLRAGLLTSIIDQKIQRFILAT